MPKSRSSTRASAPKTTARREGLPTVRRAVRAAPGRTVALVPTLQTQAPAPPVARAKSTVPLSVENGESAIVEILCPLPDGVRHVWLGDSGSGKSVANARLISAAAGLGLTVLAHDDTKAEAQIDGPTRVSPSEIGEISDAESAAGILVFRGDPYAGRACEVEDVAALAVRLARQRVRVALVIEELDRAVTPGGRELCAPSLRIALTQGRSMGLCVFSTTQSPARAPREVVDQATSIAFFRLGPRALNYLDSTLWLDSQLLRLIPVLGDFEFVLHRPGRPFDGRIYRFTS